METQHFTSKNVPERFSHKRGSSNTFWIVLISVLFFLFLVISKRNKIQDFLGFSTENISVETGFVIGEEVSVEGILTQDGDFVTHTHKLTTLSSGVFGLKSKTINLNQYSGTVVIEGIIDSEHQGLYMIDVNQVIAQLDDQNLTGDTIQTGEILPSGQYLPKAGMYLPATFFEKYTIVSDDGDSLIVKSIDGNSTIKIDYFLCKKGDKNSDCKQLSSTFSSSNDKTFTTQYDMTYYKLPEVNSWFFANKSLFGYFINDALEQDVIQLSSYLIFPTDDYVKSIIEPSISDICKQGNIVMNQIKKSSLLLEQGKIVANFDGSWDKGTVQCKLELDLSLSSFGIIKSFTYNEDGLSGSTVDVSSNSDVSTTPKPTTFDTDVKQFPISLEKTLTFTSSRGHSIVFPSSKISYQSASISENLGLAGVNCYVATKVIEYSKKDLIDSEPSVIVYECKIKDNVEVSSEYYVKPLSDGRTFLVSVLDSSWHDFANNIQVNLNTVIEN